MANVATKAFNRAILTDLLNHTVAGNFSGALYGNKIDLFTNNITLTENTVYTDLTIATFTGYTQGSAVYGAIYDNPDGSYSVQSALVQFNGPSSGTGATIYGAAVSDGSGGLLWAELFTTPVTLAVADDAVIYGPQMTVSSLNSGAGTVIT